MIIKETVKITPTARLVLWVLLFSGIRSRGRQGVAFAARVEQDPCGERLVGS